MISTSLLPTKPSREPAAPRSPDGVPTATRTTRPGYARLLATLMVAVFAVPTARAESTDGRWTQFRGPRACGFVEEGKTPSRWNVATGENIVWKTRIPGLAHASPVIWGDRLFVTTAESTKGEAYLRVGLYGESPDHPENYNHRYKVFCLERPSGRILWSRTAHEGVPKVKRHVKATHANCTPATDGNYVVAFFGSQGLYCYDFDGDLIWKKDLGILDGGPYREGWRDIQWGFASSPIIHDGRVIVQCDTRTQKFVAAFDIKTGKERLRIDRDDLPTYATPTVHASKTRTQIIVNGYEHIGGYEFSTGDVLWRLHGGGDVPTPTPVVADGLIYITNAHGAKAPIYAIKTTASGEITLTDDQRSNEHIVWSYNRRGAYMQTPLIYRGVLYNCRDNGSLTAYDAKTGSIHYRKRLAGGRTGFTASPVASDGKVYFTSEEGDVYVIRAGTEFQLLSRNKMEETCMATPAIAGANLYFRTRSHVVAIGEKK